MILMFVPITGLAKNASSAPIFRTLRGWGQIVGSSSAFLFLYRSSDIDI